MIAAKNAPRMAVVREIEDELGPIPALRSRLEGSAWKVTELVSLTHIARAAAGYEEDYDRLGDRMIRDGIEAHRRAALEFLGKVMT